MKKLLFLLLIQCFVFGTYAQNKVNEQNKQAFKDTIFLKDGFGLASQSQLGGSLTDGILKASVTKYTPYPSISDTSLVFWREDANLNPSTYNSLGILKLNGSFVVGSSHTSNNRTGIYSRSYSSYGVNGASYSGIGLFGESTTYEGVNGSSVSGSGIHGGSSSSYGVYGSSTSGYAIFGVSTTSVSGVFDNASGNTANIIEGKLNHVDKFTVDKDGNVNIASGAVYKVNGTAISQMTYPGSGIPNSTGSAWGTSYSTTGSGTVVALATSPSLTTPTLGVASATSINKVTITTPATSATLTIADGATLQQTGAYTLNLTASATTTPSFPAGTYTLAAFWTPETATTTRASNTTFTVAGDKTTLYSRKMVIKWTESSSVHCAMVVSSSYSSPNTTVTIIGDVMASIDAGSLKYTFEEPRVITFAIAGTLGATGTDVAQAYYSDEAYRVIGADVYTGTAGTTNSTTFDINKGGTTMFTTKPTIASTATAGVGFTADDNTSLALSDKVTIDIDAVQTTAAVDGYIKLFVFPTKYLSLP